MGASAQWTGTPAIKGSSEAMRMALLTASLIGLQFTWGVEMTYCTPYLLQLGLTKSKISLVWIAGPLSGLVMQPVVGVVSDRSRSRWGRRRPFMVGGVVVVAACLLVLGWTRELVGVLRLDDDAARSATIAVAVLGIYAVDFAINAVQGSCRSLIVDTLPIPKQQLGSSWATRMVAVGSLIGYAAGATDLEAVFGTVLGDTQFKQMTVVAAVFFCLTVGITSWAVTERVLVCAGDDEQQLGALQVLRQIFHTARNLPHGIAAICLVQFWAWIGWFPFLFYSATWVGEMYLRYEAPADVRQDEDALGQVGRIGSTSLIAFSVMTFIMSVVLPWFVRSPEDEARGFARRPPTAMASVVTRVEKYKPSLLTTWTLSHCVFAASMMLAPFVTSLRSATMIVAACGISWSVTCWAPFTFIGVEINRLSAKSGHEAGGDDSVELVPGSPAGRAGDDADRSTGEGSGVYLGMLNLYTTLPQFVGTFVSWVVFSLLEPGKSPELAQDVDPEEHHATADGPNAIAVCLFIGALAAAVAAVTTERRLRRATRRPTWADAGPS